MAAYEEDLLNLEDDFGCYEPPFDLNEPQPWFLRFTEPILDDKPTDDKPVFPWPPGAPIPIVSKTEVTLQEVLDFICKPYTFEEDGHCWKQQVSDMPSDRTYMQNLKANLDEALTAVRSKIGGFCPYRNRIFNDAFSEVIRIVTVSMKERGILLMRVKDDIEATVKQYGKLYKSSMAYAIRKQFKVEEKKVNLEMIIQDLRDNTIILEEMAEKYEALSLEAMEKIKVQKEQELNNKMLDLQLLRRATFIIENCIFKIICDQTQKQRKRFLKTVLAFKSHSDQKKQDTEDITGLFTKSKSPTWSSSSVTVEEQSTTSLSTTFLSADENNNNN